MGDPVRRDKGTPYEARGLGDASLTGDQRLDAMMVHPILINRPSVLTPRGARLCRPAETVRDLPWPRLSLRPPPLARSAGPAPSGPGRRRGTGPRRRRRRRRR
ncbi:ArsC/Spx/MgsR family protein [Belnapia rosea]|uniref:ArsC/Spx/MgsR family protein n=1 Tax=Belnapia rosea TaxID=938405 RepID=UPI000B86DB46